MAAKPIPFGSKPIAPIPFGSKPLTQPVAPVAPVVPAEDPNLSKNPIIRGAQQFSTGVAKGELSTIQGLGQLVLKGTDAVGLTKNKGNTTFFEDPKTLDTKGTAQGLGKGAEQIAEFFTPGGAGADVAKVGGYLAEHAPVIAKTLNVAKKGLTIGVKGGGVVAAQTGDPVKGAKAIPAFTALGIAGEAIAPGVKALKSAFDNRTNAAQKLEALIGQIAQGKAQDVPRFKQALSEVNVKGVKTYADLVKAFNSHIEGLSEGLDNVLDTHGVPKQLSDLDVPIKSGDQIVKHNFVADALGQLHDFYTKTNDPANVARINTLLDKGNSAGLTIREINDLAREHGKVLSGFNANGEAASGLTKQAAENTRSGIKATGRELFGSDLYGTVDEHLTSLIKARDLTQSTAEAVTKLQQKIKERGLGEKAGRLVYQIADNLTGHGLSGFIRAAIPRGQGLKVLNALDLEKALSKNLARFQKLSEDKGSATEITAKLQSFLDEVKSERSKQLRLGPGKPSPIPMGGLDSNLRPVDQSGRLVPGESGAVSHPGIKVLPVELPSMLLGPGNEATSRINNGIPIPVYNPGNIDYFGRGTAA